MVLAQDDCFVVFVREENESQELPAEAELVRCHTYEEARWVCRKFGDPHRRFVIRFLGSAGGGD
jgi:hypothetical protein